MGSFDCTFSSKNCVPKSILESVAEVSKIHSPSEKISKLDEYVNGLQDEMKKIDAYVRELPLCVLLLNNAISTMKEKLIECKKSNEGRMLEEFIPLNKRSIDYKDEKVESIKENDKMNWLSSVQLWNSGNHNQLQNTELSLKTPEIENFKGEINYSDFSSKSSSSATNDQSNFTGAQQQTGRKQRRSWSPELHRQFVNALHILGGAQVATPKQIREHMQVDGLTNDEVKSHLQKYRIHTRKVPPSTKESTNKPVVLGGLYNSRELCVKSSKQSNSQSGSPHGPLQLPSSSRGSMEEEDEDK